MLCCAVLCLGVERAEGDDLLTRILEGHKEMVESGQLGVAQDLTRAYTDQRRVVFIQRDINAIPVSPLYCPCRSTAKRQKCLATYQEYPMINIYIYIVLLP